MARAAIIGAGPAGFYAAEHLLREDFAVDLFDRLPSPMVWSAPASRRITRRSRP